MENKINIAELLKDCPSGMELDCILFDDDVKVIFDGVDGINTCASIIKIVVIHDNNRISHALTKYGQWNPYKYAKCAIFPKGKTTWEGFVPPCKFEDGNVIYTKTYDSKWISIFEKFDDDECKCYVNYCIDSDTYYGKIGGKKNPLCEINDIVEQRFASEEEKQKLFQAIKDNGYHWNSENKTLKKLIVPKFKVGDRIKHKEKTRWVCTIARVKDRYYVDGHPMCFTLPFGKQDDYELVPNKFDITTLVPFESRVLVRDSNKKWRPAVYGFCNKFETRCAFYAVGGCVFEECIPYKNNEHLLGTTNDCDDFYKTWE